MKIQHKNNTKSFLNAMNSYSRTVAKRSNILKQIDKIKLTHKTDELMQTLLKSDKHVKLVEFIYFKFLLTPAFNSINIFDIFDDYFLVSHKKVN